MSDDRGSPAEGLELRPVFRTDEIEWSLEEEMPDAIFDPQAQLVYVIEPRRPGVRAINFHTKKTVRQVSYGYLPCPSPRTGQGEREIAYWRPFLRGSYIAMLYCDSWYLLDVNSLEPIRFLDEVEGLTISSRGDLTAVQTSRSVELHDSVTWKKIAGWTEPPAWGFEFTSDSKFLARIVSTYEDNKLIQRGVEFRDPRLGKVVNRWLLDAKDSWLFDIILFLPGEGYTFASRGLFNVTIWDGWKGKLLRTITDRRKMQDVDADSFSRDGNWLAASVRDDPWDTPEYQQDFKIWDIATGQVLYESSRVPWPEFLRRELMSPLRVRFSPDSKYLLVLRYRELAVYEIVTASRNSLSSR